MLFLVGAGAEEYNKKPLSSQSIKDIMQSNPQTKKMIERMYGAALCEYLSLKLTT